MSVIELKTERSTDPEKLQQFAARYDLGMDIVCRTCSTEVRHAAVSFEKTRKHAIVYYEDCPGNSEGSQGPAAITNLSKKDQQQWQDLFWGLHSAMEGRPPADFVAPTPLNLDQDKVLYLGEDEPYAVLYPGFISFISLLLVANEDWEADGPNEWPYQEVNCHYLYCRTEGDRYILNVDPQSPGAAPYTVVYWDYPRAWQGV